MDQDFKQAADLINASAKILLTMHERMDGDDGGALLAVGIQLEKMGKQVTYAIKKGVASNLTFLPGADKIQDDITTSDFDLLITFGCSSIDRTGSEKIKNLVKSNHSERSEESLSANQGKGSLASLGMAMPIINIDHHPDNTNFGDVNVVDAKKSSVAELIYDFFIFNKWEINKNVATCLLTGIITDTGSFMHANTQSSTLEVAGQLMKKGASVSKIIKHTYKSKSPNILKAWGKAMENSYYDSKNKIIYSVMTDKDLAEFEKLPGGAFEGFAETLNTMPEAKFAMFLRQDGNVIKGSLRSDIFKNVDVSQIAKAFGGGGHKLASGFSVAGKLMKDEQGKWRVV
jgi:phosphoesterase RecJ-like protein